MSFYFHPEAEVELQEAVNYYQKISNDLGYDFAVEAYAAIKRAEAMPKAWALIETNIRRTLLVRFPYGVLYSETVKGIYILAVMNLHKKPDYWKYRN